MGRNRVVIVGGGFAGYHAAERLAEETRREEVEIVLVNPTDYFLYLPLLPEVAAGILDPRAITVSLPGTLPRVRLVLGEVTSVDPDQREIAYTDPEDNPGQLSFDQLILAAGSVNKLLPIPGVATHGHGFRGIPEALYFRDHVTRQIELAATTTDQAERDARCTFVVVGAGYTGTEIAAQGPDFTRMLANRHPELANQSIRWKLLDVAPRLLPGLDQRLSRAATDVLRARGVELLTGTSIEQADTNGVTLDSGQHVPTHSLIWCVGVRPDPLVESLGLETREGRIAVDETLNVPGYPRIFACGDAAGVPDRGNPGGLTAMTAQHATRQGKLAASNVVASLRDGTPKAYRHRDLGFVVDLGAHQAAANPLHIPMSGFPAKVVTRAYHLMAMPANRLRVAVDWTLEATAKRQCVQLGMVRSGTVPLDTSSPEVPDLRGEESSAATSSTS
ncbi:MULTISPECIES: NAD(P)/FAD-dependent oxidoreductase [unclassified Actinopolyspora]|uniref:NAD(P)/FAD-dependent oxidoreductase n=1 Tax=unclassified Actinopolyspora TaxID=2639451 RepID=UPI0013F6452E|nr:MULTISPECIES: NAD(P)/FAD-dependent oxidoreductase [unclassified Actinopolyspora]NHD17097.1 NAD(P)/FAD-dependent oxidoreductase [Actinopolyspora sp. BKK2]NHE76249.1 NAD(P)/FAD-dependent oxidoreductase [Actinopolyspora sp. BKK1]